MLEPRETKLAFSWVVLKLQEIIWEFQFRNAASPLQTDGYYSSTRMMVPAVLDLCNHSASKLFHCPCIMKDFFPPFIIKPMSIKNNMPVNFVLVKAHESYAMFSNKNSNINFGPVKCLKSAWIICDFRLLKVYLYKR